MVKISLLVGGLEGNMAGDFLKCPLLLLAHGIDLLLVVGLKICDLLHLLLQLLVFLQQPQLLSAIRKNSSCEYWVL